MGRLNFLLVAALVAAVNGSATTFKAPEMTDDEKGDAIAVPKHLRCDACISSVFHIYKALVEAEAARPAKLIGRPLAEDLLFSTLDKVCKEDWPENFGIKTVNGVNHLSGPGSPYADIPGLMMGGGRWPKSVRSFCMEIIGELGEEDVYAAHRKQLAANDEGYAHLPAHSALADALCMRKLKHCTANAHERAKAVPVPGTPDL